MAHRSPAQIDRFIEANMAKLDLGVQYLGSEPNAVGKPWDQATVRWCLVASWPYEQAAGNQSIPAVYKCINDGDLGFLCDRFYLPATPRDMRLLENAGIPVFGIESKHPLLDFDVIGSSISYPVLSMSYLKMLAMSGIPMRWKDRQRIGPERFPMVMVGGQSYGAPEVLAPVVDAWWCGEAEDEPGNPGVAAVTARIAGLKHAGTWQSDRLGCYQALAREFTFLYFPRFIDVHYGYEDRSHAGVGPNPSKQVVGYSGNLPGMRLPIKKRHVKDLDAIAPLIDPPLLFADAAMGSGDIEAARSCPAFCSFCALALTTKPYRQRSVPYMIDYAKKFAENMGSVRMAPFSPDFPMHTQKKALIAALLEQVSDEVDAPTMRVDDFIADDQFILLQVYGGMDSVTLGVEGSSQRMRDLLGKGVADSDVHEAVSRGIRAGIRKFKLYMISNLPGEDEGDVFRILRLAKDLADIRESMNQPTVQIQFSWTPLLIEANTPLQWFAAQTPNRLLGDAIEELRDLKIDGKIGAKAEPNKMAFFQLCQRASRDVGEALVDAMEQVNQACWGGVPRTFKALIEDKLHAHGFHNGYLDCLDEREKVDMFGWEFISTGVSIELLWRTYVQMREFIEQTDSHTYDTHFDAAYRGAEWTARCDESCQGKACGACSHEDLRIRTRYLVAATQERDIDLSTITLIDQRSQAVRIRAQIHKPPAYRFIGNDHWRFALRRAAFRAQATLGLTHGIAKRSIRFASDEIRYRDWTCGLDYLELAFTRPMDDSAIAAFLGAVNTELGDTLHIGRWVRHSVTATLMRGDVDANLFELEIDTDIDAIRARLRHWRDTAHIPMQLKIEGGYFAPSSESVNAKDYVDDLWLVKDGHRLKLRMLLRGRPSPYNVYAALTGQASWLDAAKIPAIRLEAFVGTDRTQQDFLRPNCEGCGMQVPTNILDEPYDTRYCPRCKDDHDGIAVATSYAHIN